MRDNPSITSRHKTYELMLHDKDKLPVLAFGSAGTGKTYGAVQAALAALNEGSIDKIIVTRPNVSFADKSGHLPGSEREKMDPWIRPILQILAQLGLNRGHISDMEKHGRLVFYPLEFIQGMTFDNSFVIVDECQNMSIDQLRVMLQRMGRYSKLVLCGDIAQVSPRFHMSGLGEFVAMCEEVECDIHMIEFGIDDVVRSRQCKHWIQKFEEWEKVNGTR
jgi:phosphate starvation-inducible PhoH-like protein